jgi:hypothetical protein
MSHHTDYYHWVLGENILRDDRPTYLINLELGVSIRLDYAASYFASYEEFSADIADVQFITGERPTKERVEEIKKDAWNFLALFERKEEELAYERSED